MSGNFLVAADIAPVLIHKTDLSEGIPKAGVLLDIAEVEMTVDQMGVPFSLKSSLGLPVNVADGLEGWRWSPYKKNHQSVPFSIKLTIPIVRKITAGTEQSLGRFWYPPRGEANDAIKLGLALNESTAAVLETKLSEGSDACNDRTSLLVYYAGAGAKMPEKARAARAKLLTWMVVHDPQCEILGSPFSLVNSSGDARADAATASQLADLWLDAVKLHPDDSAVVQHALNFLGTDNGPKAMPLLAGNYNKERRTTEWAGHLDALTAIG